MTRRRNSAQPVIKETFTSEEHPWKIYKTQLLPSGRSRSVTLGFVMADNIVEAHQRAVAVGHIPATAKSSPGDVYDDTATVRDGKNGSWHIEIVWEQEDGQPRPNPPLPEHMAHDDLDEIAESLAARFVRHPAGFIPFLRQLFFQVHMQVHHNVKPGSDLAGLRSEARLLDNTARREFPYVSRADNP